MGLVHFLFLFLSLLFFILEPSRAEEVLACDVAAVDDLVRGFAKDPDAPGLVMPDDFLKQPLASSSSRVEVVLGSGKLPERPTVKTSSGNTEGWRYKNGNGRPPEQKISFRNVNGQQEPYLVINNPDPNKIKRLGVTEGAKSANEVLLLESKGQKYVFKPISGTGPGTSSAINNNLFSIKGRMAQTLREDITGQFRQWLGSSQDRIDGMSGALDGVKGYFYKFEEGATLQEFKLKLNKSSKKMLAAKKLKDQSPEAMARYNKAKTDYLRDAAVYNEVEEKNRQFRKTQSIIEFLLADDDKVINLGNTFVNIRNSNGKTVVGSLKSFDDGVAFPRIAGVKRIPLNGKATHRWETREEYFARINKKGLKSDLGIARDATGEPIGRWVRDHHYNKLLQIIPDEMPEGQGIVKLAETTEAEWIQFFKGFEHADESGNIVKLTNHDIQGFLYRRQYILDKYKDQIAAAISKRNKENAILSAQGFDMDAFRNDLLDF